MIASPDTQTTTPIAIAVSMVRRKDEVTSCATATGTIIRALTVTVAMRVVGVLLVSALMIVPVAVAQLVTSSFRRTMLTAMAIGVVVCVSGLTITYWHDASPGATIVVLAIGLYALVAPLRPAHTGRWPGRRWSRRGWRAHPWGPGSSGSPPASRARHRSGRRALCRRPAGRAGVAPGRCRSLARPARRGRRPPVPAA